jgi:anti-anti-sigma regulatory factor
MDISEVRKTTLILALSGKFDATTAQPFDQLRNRAAHRRSFLAGVCQQLVPAHLSNRRKRHECMQVKMVLCALKDHIRQVFDLAGFSSILSIYGSRDEAVKGV